MSIWMSLKLHPFVEVYTIFPALYFISKGLQIRTFHSTQIILSHLVCLIILIHDKSKWGLGWFYNLQSKDLNVTNTKVCFTLKSQTFINEITTSRFHCLCNNLWQKSLYREKEWHIKCVKGSLELIDTCSIFLHWWCHGNDHNGWGLTREPPLQNNIILSFTRHITRK